MWTSTWYASHVHVPRAQINSYLEFRRDILPRIRALGRNRV